MLQVQINPFQDNNLYNEKQIFHMMTKFIVVMGGVISGVGKGVAAASIGRIMKEYGYSVTAIKIDPYINFDAGTLRPTEHGEVWVTEDGGETDQDLGNYERFIGVNIPKKNSITTGQIYAEIIKKERAGEFLGETVEVIPHVPEEIKRRIKESADGFDICIVEVGGTLGEYQNSLFLFALRSLENDIGKENITYMMVSYLPIPSHIQEMKTKPTQLAITLLRNSGIEPDFVLCRGKNALDNVRKSKLARNINIKADNIISMPDVTGAETPNTLYVIPINLQEEGLGDKIVSVLGLTPRQNADMIEWKGSIENILNPQKTVKIAIVGKYLNIGNYQLSDSYLSVNEALKHAAAKNKAKLDLTWIDSKEFEKNTEDILKLKEFNGIIIPGGFGNTGVEGKIKAIRFCRENNIPLLGLCYGMQLAVVEFARNVCNLEADTTENNPATKNPVIDILPEQKALSDKGGTMRLGAYRAILKENTQVRSFYNKNEVYERHRHRYEVNPDYHEILKQNGLIFSGMSEDERLVEFIELPKEKHRFFIATQAHPEFKSSLLNPAPLFHEFIKASLKE